MQICQLVVRDFLCWIVRPYPVKAPTGATFDEHTVEKAVDQGEECTLVAQEAHNDQAQGVVVNMD